MNPIVPIALNQEEFLSRVQLLVTKDKLRYSEAICQICHEYQLDPEDTIPFISDTLKERLRLDAIRNRGIPGVNPTGDLSSYM